MKKSSYMFTNKEHTQKGIMSTILGVISLATLGYAVFMSYRRVGDVPVQYGAAVMLVMIFAFVGIGLDRQGFVRVHTKTVEDIVDNGNMSGHDLQIKICDPGRQQPGKNRYGKEQSIMDQSSERSIRASGY